MSASTISDRFLVFSETEEEAEEGELAPKPGDKEVVLNPQKRKEKTLRIASKTLGV